MIESVICNPGAEKVINNEFEEGKQDLDRCLVFEFIDDDKQAYYYQVRAWAQYSLGKYQLAVDDQESSFRLKAPTTQREFINYGSYLRKLGKFEESLDPLFKAEQIDDELGHPTMMTQYNLGWSLYEIGRYEEAISAFTKGIPFQPDYSFVYYRRGLAYDKLEEREKALDDFRNFKMLQTETGMEIPPHFLQEMNEVFLKYEELGIATDG